MDTELARLQAELSTAHTNFLQAIKQLDPDSRERSGVSGFWSAKDVIFHLIGWDKSMQEYIADPDGFDPDPLYDTDSFNAKSVAKRQHQSWKEAVDELQSSYKALQKAITTVTVDLQIYDRVCGWLKGRIKDYELHAIQIEAWMKQNGQY